RAAPAGRSPAGGGSGRAEGRAAGGRRPRGAPPAGRPARPRPGGAAYFAYFAASETSLFLSLVTGRPDAPGTPLAKWRNIHHGTPGRQRVGRCPLSRRHSRTLGRASR